jgi:hypothetical protein
METISAGSEACMTDSGLQKMAFFILVALIVYVGGTGGV